MKTLLTGRIARRGEMLTIQAELVDVAHESQLWGHQYTRNVTDILTLQETIAREISDALKLKLSGTEKKKLTKRPTENTDAYQDYLRARYFFNKYTPDGFEQAVKCCEAAIAKDPGYALAYATLADTYGSAAFFGYVLPQEGVQKAEAAARKALELGPNLAEAHHALAKESFFFRRDWATAERAFLRALELNPRIAECRMYYALMLIVLGRRDEALAHAQQALDDDPLSGIVNTAMVLVHLFTGAFDAGLTRAHRALQLDPNLVLVRQVLAFAYEQKEEFDKAIDFGGPLMAMAPGVDPRAMLDGLARGVEDARQTWLLGTAAADAARHGGTPLRAAVRLGLRLHAAGRFRSRVRISRTRLHRVVGDDRLHGHRLRVCAAAQRSAFRCAAEEDGPAEDRRAGAVTYDHHTLH